MFNIELRKKLENDFERELHERIINQKPNQIFTSANMTAIDIELITLNSVTHRLIDPNRVIHSLLNIFDNNNDTIIYNSYDNDINTSIIFLL